MLLLRCCSCGFDWQIRELLQAVQNQVAATYRSLGRLDVILYCCGMFVWWSQEQLIDIVGVVLARGDVVTRQQCPEPTPHFQRAWITTRCGTALCGVTQEILRMCMRGCKDRLKRHSWQGLIGAMAIIINCYVPDFGPEI